MVATLSRLSSCIFLLYCLVYSHVPLYMYHPYTTPIQRLDFISTFTILQILIGCVYIYVIGFSVLLFLDAQQHLVASHAAVGNGSQHLIQRLNFISTFTILQSLIGCICICNCMFNIGLFRCLTASCCIS